MTERDKFYLNVSSLITHARFQQGYATLKELYREKKPSVDYQTWVNAESGRRVPTPPLLLIMGDILNIDREALIMAYCKDKFDDAQSHAVLEAVDRRKFFNVETLMEAKDHDRSRDYVFSANQVQAMQKDVRLRLYLMYTYDRDLKTTFSRLAKFFNVEKNEVSEVVEQLQSLGLIEVINEEVRKIHPHSTLSPTEDVFGLRKQLLLKSLDLNIKPDSVFSNHNVGITEDSYKKFLGFLDFALANLIKMDKEDAKKTNNLRFEIAIVANRLSNGSDDDGKQPSLQ